MPEPEEQGCQLGEAAGVVMRRKVGVAQQMSKDMQRGPAGSVRRDVGLQPPNRPNIVHDIAHDHHVRHVGATERHVLMLFFFYRI